VNPHVLKSPVGYICMETQGMVQNVAFENMLYLGHHFLF